MKNLFRGVTMVLLAIVFAPHLGATLSAKSGGEAKYIFFFIGDGMAAPQVRLAEAALSTAEFRKSYSEATGVERTSEELFLKSLEVTGLATTNAKNRFITDSAAAGTALASGEKTDVGVVGLTPDGKRLPTIAEMAHERGMKVGIISSASIDHATPACFYAHEMSRNSYASISDQLLTSGFDYAAGGSVRWDKRAAAEGCDKATAYNNFVKQGEAKGYKFASSRAELDALKAGDRAIASIDKLTREQDTSDGSSLPYVTDLRREKNPDNRISLADFTRKGIELLEGNKGFFMMVEGGKIDWACHANDAASSAHELVAFDEAIGVAREFAARHPKETLIVVTGDHECGGLSLGFAGTAYSSAFKLLALPTYSLHEAQAEARRAIRRGASFEEMLELAAEKFGLRNDVTDGSDGVINRTPELSLYEMERLRAAYTKSVTKRKKSDFCVADQYFAAYSGNDPFSATCMAIVNNKSGVDFSSYSHTALPVMVFASGAGAERFGGYYDNTDIPKKIMEAAGM